MASKLIVVVFAVLVLNSYINQILLLEARKEASEATNEDSLLTDVGDATLDLEAPKTYGPYTEVLVDRPTIKFEIWWKVRIENNEDDLQREIELKTFINSHGVNWIGFGFTGNGKISNADWFIIWKNHKGKMIYKDCNTMTDSLHFDKSQDYDVTRRRHFNFTITRPFDTTDAYDVQLKDGYTSIVWAYGKAKSFSKVKSEIYSRWRSKKVLLYSPNSKVVQTTHSIPLMATKHLKPTKANEISPASSKSEKGGNDQQKTQDNIHAENKKKLKISMKADEKTVSGGDEDSSPEAMEDSRRAEKMLLQRQMRKKIKAHQSIGSTNHNNDSIKNGDIIQLNSSSTRHSIKTNCTGKDNRNKSWYEVIRLKENSVYYAIVGSSAILTGMIVIIFACCCSRKMPRPPRSKVAFYKVDDYDDEHVEFLKERA